MSAEQVLAELTELFRNLMVLRVCGDKTELLDIPGDWRGTLVKLAPAFDTAVLVHHIALCDQALRSLRGSTMQRPLFDALMVRLAMASAFSAIRQVLESGQLPAPATDAQKKNDALTPKARLSEQHASPSSAPAIAHSHPTPSMTSPSPDSPEAMSDEVPLPARARVAEQPDTPDSTWQAIEGYLQENHGASLVNLLNGQAKILLLDVTAGLIRIEVPGHTHTMVTSERYTRMLETAATAVLGKTLRLEIVATARAVTVAPAPTAPVAARPGPSPVQRTSPELMKRAQEMPAVQQLIEKLGAKLLHVEAIEPVAESPAEHHDPS